MRARLLHFKSPCYAPVQFMSTIFLQLAERVALWGESEQAAAGVSNRAGPY